MCNPYTVPITITPDSFFSIIAALATVAAAVAAWYSAAQSAKSLKTGSNPILYISAKNIEPERFDVYIKNIGSGLARKVFLDIPALGIKESFLNIEREKESDLWKVKVITGARPNGDRDLFLDPRYYITYRNIFGDLITTVGSFSVGIDLGRPENYRVSPRTDWDIKF